MGGERLTNDLETEYEEIVSIYKASPFSSR